MIRLTAVDIIEYRAELAGNPDALRALDIIEDCEGDLDDAAIALAIQTGQEPTDSEGWLDGYAKRWRAALCQADMRHTLSQVDSIHDLVQTLVQVTEIPPLLVVPVAIYVMKTGVDVFCQPLDEKL
jgi:hypothetical protein